MLVNVIAFLCAFSVGFAGSAYAATSADMMWFGRHDPFTAEGVAITRMLLPIYTAVASLSAYSGARFRFTFVGLRWFNLASLGLGSGVATVLLMPVVAYHERIGLRLFNASLADVFRIGIALVAPGVTAYIGSGLMMRIVRANRAV